MIFVDTRGGPLKVSSIGDSIVADAFAFDATARSWTHWGYLSWFRRFMGDKIDFPGSRSYAVGGKKVNEVLAEQLPLAVADVSQIVFVGCGTNSIGSETDAAIINGLTSIIAQLRAAGKTVVAVGIRAHKSPSSFSASNQKSVGRINRFLANYASLNSRVYYFNPDPFLLDFATGDIAAPYFRDGIHDNLMSAKILGKALADRISSTVWTQDFRFTQLGDVYDASLNPTGNLLTNGLLTGTTGTKVNGGTGSVPTSWVGGKSSNAGTITVDFSKEAYGAGYTNLDKTVITIGGTGDGTLAIMFQEVAAASSGMTAGDVVFAECEVEWNFTSAGFVGIQLATRFQNGSYANMMTGVDGAYNAGNGGFPAADSGSIILKTDPVTVPSGFAFSSPTFQVVTPVGGGAITGVVKVSRLSLRKL